MLDRLSSSLQPLHQNHRGRTKAERSQRELGIWQARNVLQWKGRPVTNLVWRVFRQSESATEPCRNASAAQLEALTVIMSAGAEHDNSK